MMNPAYLHLLINHVPVILAPLGFLVVLLALITKRRAVWLYALATLTLAGISAYPVMATGDAAGDFLKAHVAHVDREAIESHEESGDTVMWVLIVGGLIAAYGWLRLGRQREAALPIWLIGLVLVSAGFSTVGVTVTALKGGDIMHKEEHIAPASDTSKVITAPQAIPAPATPIDSR